MVKLAHYLLLPPANMLCLALAGYLLRRRLPRAGALIQYGALLLLLALSTRVVANLLAAPLESHAPVWTPERAAGAQAIVVLSAGVSPQAPEYGTDAPDALALARMRYAARLRHETGLPLLATGGRVDPDQGQSLGAGMADALRRDFRADVQWVEEQSGTTAENARYSAAMLLPAGVRRIVLVTHAIHMRRAAMAFRAAGFDVIEAPTAYYAHRPATPAQFLPSASGLSASYYASYEWFGLAWYALRL